MRAAGRSELVGRGPDCEPLLGDVEPVARVPSAVVREARALYEREFAAEDDGT